jgi:hypothetical protein
MAWKRQYRVHLAWVILGVPLFAAVLAGAVATLMLSAGMQPVLEALATRVRVPRGAVHTGPGVFDGWLRGPPSRVDPLGNAAAAWVGWVTLTTGSGRNSHTTTVCRTREVDELLLDRGQGSLRLRLVEGSQPTRVLGRNVMQPTAAMPALDFGERIQRAVIPPRALEGCAPPASSGTLTYYEVRAPPGAHVEVSACQSGAELRPCGDRLDLVSTRGTASIASEWAGNALVPARILLVATVALCMLFGCAAVRRHVRLLPRGSPP